MIAVAFGTILLVLVLCLLLYSAAAAGMALLLSMMALGAMYDYVAKPAAHHDYFEGLERAPTQQEPAASLPQIPRH